MSTKCLNEINALISRFDISLNKLQKWVSDCYSNYPLQSINNIRKLLNNGHYTIINQVIETGVIQHIMKLLKKNTYQFEMLCSGYVRELNLQYQVPQEIIDSIDRICVMDKTIDNKLQSLGRWILCNITSGTPQQTKYIVDNGGISILIDGIIKKGRITTICVQTSSIQALGNIAGDNTEYRDLLLSNDTLSKLLSICNHIIKMLHRKKNYPHIPMLATFELSRCITWTLSNFCRGIPSPEEKYVDAMIKMLSMMINLDDAETLEQICWAFSYLIDSDPNNDELHIQKIIKCPSCSLDRFIQLLDDKNYDVRHAALRTIGNIIAGTDIYTEDLIKLGILDKLYKLMYDESSIKRDACWTLSNIVGEPISNDQIELVVAANLFHPCLDILKTEEYEIAKEALWTIFNVIQAGTDSQIAFLMYIGVITALCQFLRKQTDPKHAEVIRIGLEGIEYILDAGKRLNKYGSNQFIHSVEEDGGIGCLEQIRSNKSLPADINNIADEIIKQYFNGENSINKSNENIS